MEYTHFYCKERDLNFIWIYLSLDTETTSVSLFYNIESYFVTIHRTDKYFYPTALKGSQGIVFTHGVQIGGQAAGKSLSRLYLRNLKV